MSVHYVPDVSRDILARPLVQVEVANGNRNPLRPSGLVHWMMKHPTLIAFAALLVFWSSWALAQETVRSWQGTISARNLNVRAGPGKTQEIVAKLKRGNRVVAFDEDGRWVHIREFDDSGKTGWVSRSFIRLPKEFMAPAFGDVENAFLEWASERGDLAELSVDADNRLSMVLDPGLAESHAPRVAREVACHYRTQLSLDKKVVATVWPETGIQNGWVTQVSCP